MVYYNELDPNAAAWLRELIRRGHIPAGDVDERSIADVQPEDLRGYDQCHFFAGIGGWPYALRLAGWPDEAVWTGSCPCQCHSTATHGHKTAPDLWPGWRRIVAAIRPPTIFGEQVAVARDWFDGVCDDLETMDYQVGAAVLPACSVGKDHKRYRLFFVAHANNKGERCLPINAEVGGVPRTTPIPGKLPRPHGVPARVGRLRGYGNAIVPQVAAEFIMAYKQAPQGAEVKRD